MVRLRQVEAWEDDEGQDDENDSKHPLDPMMDDHTTHTEKERMMMNDNEQEQEARRERREDEKERRKRMRIRMMRMIDDHHTTHTKHNEQEQERRKEGEDEIGGRGGMHERSGEEERRERSGRMRTTASIHLMTHKEWAGRERKGEKDEEGFPERKRNKWRSRQLPLLSSRQAASILQAHERRNACEPTTR